MRVRTKLQVSISDTEQEERDLGYPLIDDTNDTPLEGGTLKAYVPVATTNMPLPLGTVASASYIFIRTQARDPNDTPVSLTFKKNDVGGEAITVAPMGNTRKGVFLLSTSGVTSLFVSNAGAVNMEVIYSVAGD